LPVFADNRPLLDAFRRGERDALERVYLAYVDDVDVLVRRGFTSEANGHLYVPGVRDPEVERDLVQEVFTRAFTEQARIAYDGLRAYRPYVLRIAKNLLVDQLRQRKHATVALDEANAGDIDDIIEHDAAVVDEAIADKTLADATREFVASLDEESRTFVAQRFEGELSQDEVAANMRITRRRVRTLEERVQTGLRRHLTKRGLL
jgi:RNA polymerase sigma-70 factor (ECF subfamily)